MIIYIFGQDLPNELSFVVTVSIGTKDFIIQDVALPLKLADTLQEIMVRRSKILNIVSLGTEDL